MRSEIVKAAEASHMNNHSSPNPAGQSPGFFAACSSHQSKLGAAVWCGGKM